MKVKSLLKKKVVIPVLALTIFFTGTAFKSDFFEIAKQIEIFTTLFKELNMNYVDDTNPADLMDTAIKGMLDELDPYTQYYNEQDVEASRINNTGDYTGIGASVRTAKDKLIIVEPYKDYPADKAGLKAGDEIIKVGNTVVADFKDDAGELLKGAAGTSVEVTYTRQGKTAKATIDRSEVDISAVPHFSMVDDKTGYVVLSKFTRSASKEVKNAIRELKVKGADKLILDLRSNPGGLLLEAVNIVNLFVPKGQLVVTTKSKVKKFNKTYYTQNEPLDTKIPVVVLINGSSASASEIVSGALQDLDRAVVVGSRSFGKGLVQRPRPLTYGTQLKITISRYYTPSGRCIQSLDYWNRDKDGNAVRISKDNYSEFKTKNGRPVFDGGGVMPDVDMTIVNNKSIIDAIVESNLVFDYATNYYYKNQGKDISDFTFSDADYNDFKSYLKSNNFTFETKTEKLLDKAIKSAKKEDLLNDISAEYSALTQRLSTSKNNAIDANKAQLQVLLTDEIIKRYVYREGLYEYYLKENPEIKKATSILSNTTTYQSYFRP